jgi:hypothetical protein
MQRCHFIGQKPLAGECLLGLAMVVEAGGDVGRAARLWGARTGGAPIGRLERSENEGRRSVSRAPSRRRRCADFRAGDYPRAERKQVMQRALRRHRTNECPDTRMDWCPA